MSIFIITNLHQYIALCTEKQITSHNVFCLYLSIESVKVFISEDNNEKHSSDKHKPPTFCRIR